MDAVLKHLGLRSDFIVCHPDVIDDPLPHAPRPPYPQPPHPRPLLQPFTSPFFTFPSSLHSLHIYWEFQALATFIWIQEYSIDFLIA